MKHYILTLLLLTTTFLSKGQLPVDYIRTGEYEETRLTIKDLKKIISSIDYYYSNTEIDSLDNYNKPNFKCDIIRKDKALTFSSFKQVNSFEIEDESYSEVSIYYRWDNKSISSVNIILHESFRRITIKGNDEKKVEALFRDIDSKLKDDKTSFAWLDFDIIVPTIFTTLLIFTLLIFPTLTYNFIKGIRDRKTVFILIVTGIYFLIGLVFFFSEKSIRDIFPSFELTQDNTSWLDRNTNMLGFIGLILTIIPSLFTFYKWGMTKNDNSAKENDKGIIPDRNRSSKAKNSKK